MSEKTDALFEKASRLPRSPGVYIMKNAQGNVIYVGKSKALKNRVSQYFQRVDDHPPKTRKMVLSVDDFSYILTDTEMEALTLENSLIKHHAPKYNIKLKDDKNYPYIRVSVDEPYPKLKMVRRHAADKAKYYGPYSSGQTAWQLMMTIQKIFGLARCNMKFPEDIGKKRPCIYQQMGACVAPCTGKVSSEAYHEIFGEINTLLRGSVTEVKKHLTEQMNEASEALAFEKAAQLRDRLNLITHIWEKQKVVSSPDTEQDVIAFYQSEVCTCVSVFYVRDGMLIDTEHRMFGAEQLFDAETLPQFLLLFYEKRAYVPKEILLDFPVPEDDLSVITQALSEKAGRRVYIRIPQRGESKGLCTMARENAEEHGKQYAIDTQRDNRNLIRLAKLLRLEVVPERIESYDISNYGAENGTAGMIVVQDGAFLKKEYRTFSIRSVTQDDYGAMREAVERRMTHLRDADPGFDTAPDLILLDGGVGHVNTIRALLSEMNLDIPVFGMVKDDFHKTRALTDGENEINIAHEQSLFVFIYKIQEEVHRYTITRMKNAKSKTLRHSSLEKIDGVGPGRAKALLAYFPSLAAIKTATVENLNKAPGMNEKVAQHIYDYFHEDKQRKGDAP